MIDKRRTVLRCAAWLAMVSALTCYPIQALQTSTPSREPPLHQVGSAAPANPEAINNQEGNKPISSPQLTSVGFPGRWHQVVLPGPELNARPIVDRSQPIVLRIETTYPHGTDFRYDLVYVGLEPGKFNLSDYLIRRDGGPRQDLPPLLVEIQSVLPPDQIRPSELLPAPTGFNSYYLISLLVAAMVWVLGLIALIFGRRVREQHPQRSQQNLSLAERLRPLVHRATRGQLTSQERADLERILINYWRERLRVQDLPADKLIKYLKQHDEAGQLLRQLEVWLHSPRGADDASIAEILKPYESS